MAHVNCRSLHTKSGGRRRIVARCALLCLNVSTHQSPASRAFPQHQNQHQHQQHAGDTVSQPCRVVPGSRGAIEGTSAGPPPSVLAQGALCVTAQERGRWCTGAMPYGQQRGCWRTAAVPQGPAMGPLDARALCFTAQQRGGRWSCRPCASP